MRKIIFNTMFFLGINRLFFCPSSPIVLCFHRVSHQKNPAYPPLSPVLFKHLLDYCTRKFDVVDLSELTQGKEKKQIAITFDDGFHDFIIDALPILELYKVPVTLNIITSCASTGQPHWTQKLSCLVERFAVLGVQPKIENIPFETILVRDENEENVALKIYEILQKKELNHINCIIENWEKELDFNSDEYTKMIKWDSLKSIIKMYPWIKIGSHTTNHTNLMADQSENLLHQEIIESAFIIEKELGIKVDRFAFPNGAYSPLSLKVVEQSQYKYIQLTDNKPSKQTGVEKEYFTRYYPHFSSMSENIFYIFGFHKFIEKITSKVRRT